MDIQLSWEQSQGPHPNELFHINTKIALISDFCRGILKIVILFSYEVFSKYRLMWSYPSHPQQRSQKLQLVGWTKVYRDGQGTDKFRKSFRIDRFNTKWICIKFPWVLHIHVHLSVIQVKLCATSKIVIIIKDI